MILLPDLIVSVIRNWQLAIISTFDVIAPSFLRSVPINDCHPTIHLPYYL